MAKADMIDTVSGETKRSSAALGAYTERDCIFIGGAEPETYLSCSNPLEGTDASLKAFLIVNAVDSPRILAL